MIDEWVASLECCVDDDDDDVSNDKDRQVLLNKLMNHLYESSLRPFLLLLGPPASGVSLKSIGRHDD